jgi:hypothetical protein
MSQTGLVAQSGERKLYTLEAVGSKPTWIKLLSFCSCSAPTQATTTRCASQLPGSPFVFDGGWCWLMRPSGWQHCPAATAQRATALLSGAVGR